MPVCKCFLSFLSASECLCTCITKTSWSSSDYSPVVLLTSINHSAAWKDHSDSCFSGILFRPQNWYFLSHGQKALSVVTVCFSLAIKGRVALEYRLSVIATLATSAVGRKRAGHLQSPGAMWGGLKWPEAQNSETHGWKGLYHPNFDDASPRSVPVPPKWVDFLQNRYDLSAYLGAASFCCLTARCCKMRIVFSVSVAEAEHSQFWSVFSPLFWVWGYLYIYPQICRLTTPIKSNRSYQLLLNCIMLKAKYEHALP